MKYGQVRFLRSLLTAIVSMAIVLCAVAVEFILTMESKNFILWIFSSAFVAIVFGTLWGVSRYCLDTLLDKVKISSAISEVEEGLGMDLGDYTAVSAVNSEGDEARIYRF